MKRFLKSLACVMATLTLAMGLGACEMQFVTVTVTSIEKTSTDGLIDTYTITYSDGTQSTFEVTNGADGKDGENGKDGEKGEKGDNGALSVDDLFERYTEIG